MKVTDLRRKLIAALIAGGSLAPGAAYAADLNVNLVTNGGFENVDLSTTYDGAGNYNAPRILDWLGTSVFAYSHDGSSSNGGVVPDYADGADPTNAGHWYFTSNSGQPDPDAPGEFYQDIDVSTGATAPVIASGFGGFTMSASISSYATQSDVGNLHANFRTGSGVSLGTAMLADSDPGPNNVWSLNTATGIIPIGTAAVRLSLYGTAATGGPDGYIDNVDFRVSEVSLPALRLTVSRADGSMVLSNSTGSPVNLSGYSLTSAFEALLPANWRSITDNYDAGNPGPNQVDPAHNWSELTDPNAHGDLSEADLEAGTGGSIANGRTVNLGNAGTWIQNPNEDLVFQYVSGGQVTRGIVSFIGNGNNPFALGDLNVSGSITSADWVILRTNQFADLSSLSLAEAYRRGDLTSDKLNNHADFAAFKTAYEAANGSGSFAAMLSSVPEPSSVLLVLAAGLFALPVARRSINRK
jgi:PEP-CTERM motif